MGFVQQAVPKSKPRRLERWLHKPVEVDIPFYDPELDVPHSKAHRIMAYETGSILASIAEEAGLSFLSDESIWYLDPKTETQRVFYGDWVLAAVSSTDRITADDLVVVVEVVTTTEKRKQEKDTVFQKRLNEYNEVPEFGLVFPEVFDTPALIWHRLVDGKYEAKDILPGETVNVAGVPGLQIRVKPREKWTPGHKFDVLYQGSLWMTPKEEHKRADEALQKAEQALGRAEAEKLQTQKANQRAETERQRANAEKQRAQDADLRANAEKQRAQDADLRANAEKQRAEKLAAQLRALGHDPDSIE